MKHLPWLLLLFASSAAHAQSSRPAGGPADPSALRAQLTLVYELDETAFRVQEMWQIDNPTGGTVPAGGLVFRVPASARGVRLGDDVPFELADGGTTLVSNQGLGPGPTQLNLGYEVPLDDDSLDLDHTFPVAISLARVIFQRFPGMEVTGLGETQTREREFDGIHFRVFDLAGLPMGHRLTGHIAGIPLPSRLPKHIAVLLSLGALVWLAVGLGDRSRSARPVLGVLSATARRDQILRALELLETERANTGMKDKAYEKRREALVKELSSVLEEIELQPRGAEPA